MEDLQFDTTPSLSRDYIYRYEDSPDANFITIYPGEIKVQVFNPDNAGGSPAGARRMKVEYTSLLGATPSTPTGTSSYALRGPAVGDWTTHDINNCLVGISGYDGRYLSLTRAFNADDFKIFVYKQTLNEPYQRGFIDFDDHKSNASNVIMLGDPSSGYHESFHVNTAGNYMVVYDLKMQKIYFHNAGTTYHKVTKYYGELLIEEAAAFTGLNYTPAPFYQPEKKFVGWYEDALLETAYVPKDLTSDITLYAKFVDSPSVNLRFYDRNLDIKVDNGGFNEYVVFAYGKNTDGTEPLGGWPGRMMQKVVDMGHELSYGYYALNISGQDRLEKVTFNNGCQPFEPEHVSTPELVLPADKNLYEHDVAAWSVMTPVHDAATSYAINFLYETRNCDATGAVNNISSHKWEELGNLFNELAPDVQADLKNATATLSGDLVSQAMARYVYILQKYGTVTFTNFIDRTLPPSGIPAVRGDNKQNFYVLGIMAFIAVAGFFFLNRKRRY